jgi:hypothetical protein
LKRLALLYLVLAAGASPLGASPAMAADPNFTISSNPARTGNLVKFTAASPGSSTYSWDLDGDGVYGDKTGSPVTWAYATPGPVTVGLQAPDPSRQSTEVLQVLGPSAAFVSFPAAPVPGEQVTFAYSSHEATQKIEWDLNGDGVFGEVIGPMASRSFPAPGSFPVSLRVTDLDDAVSTATQFIAVALPTQVGKLVTTSPARLMTPFPVVRITGKASHRGARIKRLTVNAPYGATVTVRCRGRGCPFRIKRRTVARAGRSSRPSRTIRIAKFERRLLRPGATVKVLVSKPHEIGKYTSFKIRRRKSPLRTDSCLQPGETKPISCPVT